MCSPALFLSAFSFFVALYLAHNMRQSLETYLGSFERARARSYPHKYSSYTKCKRPCLYKITRHTAATSPTMCVYAQHTHGGDACFVSRAVSEEIMYVYVRRANAQMRIMYGTMRRWWWFACAVIAIRYVSPQILRMVFVCLLQLEQK